MVEVYEILKGFEATDEVNKILKKGGMYERA